MKASSLTTKNTVFFSTANNDYVFQAATSLISIRRFLPDAKLYIISRHISKRNKAFLKAKKIDVIELDLTYLFFQNWQYPTECYYLFVGPKLFSDLGFQYSVYIDDDILCLDNPLKNCPAIDDIGGVAVNTFDEFFDQEKNQLSKLFNIKISLFEKRRLNSGVIYMNNSALTKLDFLETAGKIYYECWNSAIPRKGDDSLFALLQLRLFNKLKPVIFESHPYKHIDKAQAQYNVYVKQWQHIGRQLSFSRWFKTLSFPIFLRTVVRKISKYPRQFLFVLRGTKLTMIRRMINIRRKSPINLYWWQPAHINNFGDTVSKDIILNIFGRAVEQSSIDDCSLVAAGSIMEVAQSAKRKTKFFVWGTGFIRSDSQNDGLDAAIFRATRGNLTKKRVGHNVPTGDPGLLINSTYNLHKKRNSKKIGVVIHYADMQLPIVKKFCEDSRFEVITPLDSSENVAKKIADCCLILSSSLHGLIFADSLSIPNIHIKLSNNLTGGEYKFLDYYSGVDKPYEPADISKIFTDSYLKQIKINYKPVPNLRKKQRQLVKVFPFK